MTEGTHPIIRLEGVRKAYGTGKARQQVLRGVSLEVAPGEMVALVGQSGSGKSTLLNVIGGLDRADDGTVEIAGRDTRTMDDETLSRLRNERIGFIFQAFHLLDHLSCLENVYLPAYFARGGDEAWEDRALEALARVGMRDLAHRRPTELSGGQKQRVAIARALFGRPSILLCDEPTGNLDSETGRDVITFFQDLNRTDGVTLILVTHEERVSEAARRVLRISDGLIVSEGAGVPARAIASDSASREGGRP